jgi:Asp-tRNA(Asn)/Glu-tRNA(Gln) amidotransferase A subunit family amidase
VKPGFEHPKASMTYFTATQALKQLQDGKLQPSTLLQFSLKRIQQREPDVRAWQSLAIETALQKAQRFDQQPTKFQAMADLPLRGIPVAIKDIFSTADLPTTWGTSIYQGRYLPEDAAVVARLKAAGAIILGKTVTTEFATAAAGSTRNPHNLDHTPGGSSSGSAAAVADGIVPVAIGSQTMGSILRPAAYCGIFGFKPSFGVMSRYGMMPVSMDLDHVGLFSRCLDDLELLLTVVASPDNRDLACTQSLQKREKTAAYTLPPRIALILGPHYEQLEPVARDRLQDVSHVLEGAGATVDRVTLTDLFQTAWEDTQNLCALGLATHHGEVIRRHRDQVSDLLHDWVERGEWLDEAAHARIRRRVASYRSALSDIFAAYDIILTPVTTGAAPKGLEGTGSPIFCGLWTLCGVPAINLPVGKDSFGLPLGCQLVGKYLADFRLLNLARWCWAVLAEEFGDIEVTITDFPSPQQN